VTSPDTVAVSAASPPLPEEARVAHVLVVDDDPGLRRSLVRVLETRGMKVGIAEDGPQALEYIQRTPPDVALVDLTMRGFGGLDVLARVKASGAPCEVILMTAFADVDSAVAAMNAGAYQFLTKPFHSNDAVAHAVAKAAEHRRLTDRARELEEVLRSKERSSEPAVTADAARDPGSAMLADLADVPYAEAKRRLVALFDETYTNELLRRTGGNMSEAARRAGLDRSNFRRLRKRHR
jgi:DNA-binding NtrC family response regulator